MTGHRATAEPEGAALLGGKEWQPHKVQGWTPDFIPAVLDDYVELTTLRPRWREVLERRGIREVLLRPDRPLVSALRELGWRVRAEDPGSVLLARP